jgi:hypothetical protein
MVYIGYPYGVPFDHTIVFVVNSDALDVIRSTEQSPPWGNTQHEEGAGFVPEGSISLHFLVKGLHRDLRLGA